LNNRARWWIGMAISVLFLFLVVRGLDPARFWENLRQADYQWFLPASVFLVMSYALRAFRWRLLLDGQVGSLRAFSVINVGYLLNNVLPFRLSDVARAYLISRGTPVGGARGLSSVVVERVTDVLAVVILLAGVLAFALPPALAGVGGGALASQIVGAGLTMTVAALAAFTLLTVAAVRPTLPLRAVTWGLRRVPRLSEQRITGLVSQLLDGLSALSDWRRMLALFAWTAAIWGVSVLADWAVARAFVAEADVALGAFILALTGLGVSLPSSPGQWGVFEAAAVLALQAFTVPQESAVAVALTLHALGTVLSSALGALFLLREGESLLGIAAAVHQWMVHMRSSRASSPS